MTAGSFTVTQGDREQLTPEWRSMLTICRAAYGTWERVDTAVWRHVTRQLNAGRIPNNNLIHAIIVLSRLVAWESQTPVDGTPIPIDRLGTAPGETPWQCGSHPGGPGVRP